MNRGRARASSHDGVDYWTLAQLRYYIRRFLRTREMAAQKAGIAPQQYLLLLQLKGLAGTPATIGTLAERLQLRHHSTVGLVDRLAERGMVVRARDPRDRRGVVVELRPAGEKILERLARHSLQELRTEGPALLAVLRQLIGRAASRRPATRNPTKAPR
jgi:DNA-binding MarR family transcriptional regulator